MRLSLTLGGLASLSLSVTFLSHWYLLTALGPGRETDALFAGMMIPQLVLAVVSGSLIHALVPLLSVEDKQGRLQLAWTLLQGLALLFGAFSGLLILSAPVWVPWTVPGFDPPTVALTVSLVRIQLFGVVFAALLSVLGAACSATHRFIRAEVSPVVAASVGFVFLVFGLPELGVAAAAWAAVITSGLQVFLLLPVLGRYRTPRWRAPAVLEAWRRIRPILSGSLYYKSDRFVDRFLASMAPPGALSILHVAQQLLAAGHLILNKGVAVPMVPVLARKAQGKDWNGFRLTSRSRMGVMLAVTLVTAGVLVLAGRPLLSLLFEHGRFDRAQVEQFWWILVGLLGVWFGGAVGQILSSSFYAQGDTTTPTRIGVLGFTVGILLKVGGFYLFGILGIAVGTSLYYMLNVLLLQSALAKKLHASFAAAKVESALAGS